MDIISLLEGQFRKTDVDFGIVLVSCFHFCFEDDAGSQLLTLKGTLGILAAIT